MTSNAIAAMRLQEEKRHNLAQEGENIKARKSDFLGNILGATLRGLGTGILGKVSGSIGAYRTLRNVAAKNQKQSNQAKRNNNNNRKGL